MSQHPYPPPSEGERPEREPQGGERPGGAPVPPLPLGPDQPTQRLAPDHPGQREATRQFTPTGPPPGQYGLPGSGPPPGQYGLPGSGPPPWGQPTTATAPTVGPPRKSNTVLWTLVITASLVLVAVLIALVIATGES